MAAEGVDVVWIHVKLSTFSICCTERPQSHAQQPAPEFPACEKLGAPGTPGPHGIAKAPGETQWKIGTFVQVFRASVSFKALHNPSCY